MRRPRFFRLGTGDIQTLPGALSTQTIVATQVKGITSGAAPAAGSIGELITATLASGAAVSLTTATTANVIGATAITAGEWNLWGQIDFILTGATDTLITGGASLTSVTLSTQAGGGGLGTDPIFVSAMPTTTLTGTLSFDFFTTLRIASTTNVFLVAQATFSVGTITAYGSIFARRAG